MEKLEVMLWVARLQEANKGDKDAMEQIQVENEIRQEKGLPTIQEEMMKYLEEHPNE